MQSKVESFIESCLNTLTGLIVSLLVWKFLVAPAYGFKTIGTQDLQITLIFTISSIVRSYLWRRFFNRRT